MKKQSGNALWFILIAIFLLGGLTVLLSRTGGQTEETGSAEQVSIQASEILRYLSSIKSGVDQLRGRGCGENQLSFWYDSNGDGSENGSDSFYNPAAPTDRSCHIFHVNGAGVRHKNIDAKYLDTSKSARPYYGTTAFSTACVTDIGSIMGAPACNTPSVAATSAELIATIPYLKHDICKAINRSFFSNVTIPVDQFNAFVVGSLFTGSFNQNSPAINFTAPYSSYFGKNVACFTGDTIGNIVDPTEYGVYQVLIAR